MFQSPALLQSDVHSQVEEIKRNKKIQAKIIKHVHKLYIILITMLRRLEKAQI